ncbi:MAG TPA: protein kinase [Solirubrobacteraceae bacterium]|nr:protein kinase [Solirubrobacteraceae bacterium]
MLEPGRILGNYRIDGVLGRGGMGVVYEATQISLQRTVALKVIGADVSADSAFRERFRREGLIQAGLDHPHIVTVYEAGELERHLFIAMRLVRGPTLKDMIIGRELDAGRALRVLAPVADALDTAHDAGLIHRDIKPQNILVGPRDHAYLADFGLMKAVGDRALTKTGQFMGSVDYVAPEQINGREATARTDVYALGAVLYEALTGIVPFPKASDAAVLYAHMADEPPRVSEQRPELPAALDEVIAAAMAKDPQDRPASAATLLRDAERAFSRPTRAAMALPGPFEGPEDAGVRAPEARVRTVEASGVDAAKRDRGLGVTRADTGPEPVVAPAPVVAQPSVPAAPSRAGASRAWLVVPVLLALAIGGYLVGRPGSSRDGAPDPAGVATAGAVELDVPAGWTRRPAPELTGLAFGDGLAFGPAAPAAHGLVAGMVADAVGADLLPRALVQRIDGGAPDGQPVSLGEHEALRYAGLRLGGDRSVTLYATPTAAGSATVACYAPAAAPSGPVVAACERAAASLRLSDGELLPVGPVEAYGTGVRDALERRNRDRATQRAQLAAAGSRATQAAAAGRLASTADRAERAARGLTVSARDREAHDALVRALSAGGDGYRRMAAAARSGSRTRFARGAGAVRDAEAAERDALTVLGRLGYRT